MSYQTRISLALAVSIVAMRLVGADTRVTFDNGTHIELREFRFVRSAAGHTTPPAINDIGNSRLGKLPMEADPAWMIPFGVNGYWLTLNLAEGSEVWLRRGDDDQIRVADVTFTDGSRMSGLVYVGGGAWPPMPGIDLTGIERVFNDRRYHRFALYSIVHIQRTSGGNCTVSSGAESISLRECRLNYDRPRKAAEDDLEFPITIQGRDLWVPFDQVARITFDDSMNATGPVKVFLRSGEVLRGGAPLISSIRGYTGDGKFVLTKVVHKGYCIVREVVFQ